MTWICHSGHRSSIHFTWISPSLLDPNVLVLPEILFQRMLSCVYAAWIPLGKSLFLSICNLFFHPSQDLRCFGGQEFRIKRDLFLRRIPLVLDLSSQYWRKNTSRLWHLRLVSEATCWRKYWAYFIVCVKMRSHNIEVSVNAPRDRQIIECDLRNVFNGNPWNLSVASRRDYFVVLPNAVIEVQAEVFYINPTYLA